MGNFQDAGEWLRQVGEWLLDNPAGADMLGVRDRFNAVADELERLQRLEGQPVPLSDWEELIAERNWYQQGLVYLRRYKDY